MIDVAPLERTELQARLDTVMLNIIRAHVGKPCPTRRTVMEWTGVPRRQVWAVFEDMAKRGLIELEVVEARECGKDPKRRRMRIRGGKWTDWTARRPAAMVSQRGVKMTALKAAFESKGVTQRDIRFKAAIAEFQNNGGSYDVALAMLDAAYAKGSEGQPTRASDGPDAAADASPTNDGEVGPRAVADKAGSPMPASPSTSTGRGEGRQAGADKADSDLPSTASRPGHARRGAIAIASVQATLAKSLFDLTLLPDGRRLRQVRWNECPTLATKYSRLSRILTAVHNHAIPPDPNATLDTVVNEKDLAMIIASTDQLNEIR